jgi:hypothetical protein
VAAAVAYFGVKLAAYALWCLVGLRSLAGRSPGDVWRAIAIGGARVVLGLVLGLALVWVMPWVAPADDRLHFSLPAYIGALTIVRVFEWLAIGGLVTVAAHAATPAGLRTTAWVGGGVLLSYATDVLVLAVGIGIYGVPC